MYKPLCVASASGADAPKPKSRCVNPVVKKRFDALYDDAKSLYDQRTVSLSAIDKSMREIVNKEAEVRQRIVDKWVAIAKEDIELLQSKCNCKRDVPIVEPEVVQGDDIATPPPAAEAFYEPWVKDQ
jgi:hypothetical protein